MDLILILVVLAVLGAVAVGASRRNKVRELTRREDELAPVKKLAFEDITAFGEDLQQLDLEMTRARARRRCHGRLPARARRLRGRQDGR